MPNLRQRLESHPSKAVIDGFKTRNMASYTQDMVNLATTRNAVLLVKDSAAVTATKALAAKGKTLLSEAVSRTLVSRQNMLLIDDDALVYVFQSLYDLALDAIVESERLASSYPVFQDRR